LRVLLHSSQQLIHTLMRRILLFVWVVTASLPVIGQTEQSAFSLTGHGIATPFARDYQSLGINPANLDLRSEYEGRRFALGMLELGVSFYSEALTRDEVRQNIFQKKLGSMSQQERLAFAQDISNSTNSGDVDIMSTGFWVQTNKLGSFAFSIRERADFYSRLGSHASQLLWMGSSAPYFDQLVLQNGDTISNTGNLDEETLSQIAQGFVSEGNVQSLGSLLAGSRYSFSWVREFNFGYGKRVLSSENWELHGGFGVKFLVGQGLFDLDATGSQVSMFSSLAPLFNANYNEMGAENPSDLPAGSGPLKPVGFGMAVDLGATMVIKEKFYASAAVTDIGSIKWTGNLYEFNDVDLSSLANTGFGSTSYIDQINEMTGSDGLLSWQGSASRTTTLPAIARFGGGFRLPKIKAGVDVVAPLNDEVGSLDRAVIAVGGEFSPIPWVHLSAGYMQGGNYGSKIPAGIRFTFNEGGYELGVASRDMITFFTRNQPTASITMGFLRFRF